MRAPSYFLFAVLMVSCVIEPREEKETAKKEKVTKDGLVKDYFSNGKLRAEINFVKGKRHGKAKEYYKKNGKLFQEIDYADDIKHGIARKYYEDGKLFQETPYDSGLIHGIQKKYHSNGNLAAEIPYDFNNPCMGLKEYATNGKPRPSYPTIVITPVDNILKNGEYKLRISMSNHAKHVEYYRGELLSKKCLSNFMGNIFEGDEKGVGEVVYNVPRGSFIMEGINIVAKVKTLQGNYYITQRKYNVAAENRF
jgi:hypothetical protein